MIVGPRAWVQTRLGQCQDRTLNSQGPWLPGRLASRGPDLFMFFIFVHSLSIPSSKKVQVTFERGRRRRDREREREMIEVGKKGNYMYDINFVVLGEKKRMF